MTSPSSLLALEGKLVEAKDEDVRVVLCDECGSEGRIYRQSVLNPHEEVDCGPCSRCDGTGWMVVEVEPITEEDLP